MSAEHGRAIDAAEVEDRLPGGWWAENDGDQRVHAYPEDGRSPGDADGSATIAADPESDLWRATWMEHSDFTGFHEPEDSVKGTKERCAEWVAERARGAGGR